jgi:hypothetical protein
MNLLSILTMVIVLGIVWGGLAVFLLKAVKYEKLKDTNGEK